MDKKVFSIIEHKLDSRRYSVRQWIKKFVNVEIRSDHALQRESQQHTARIRDGIVVSVILHENIDSIKLCQQKHENGTTTEWLIDGKQRLSDITEFYLGKFKLGKKLLKPIVEYQVIMRDENGNAIIDEYGNQAKETREFDLRKKSFQDLPEELKDQFLDWEIPYDMHIDCTNKDIAYHIYRYNSMVVMNPSQKGILSMPNVAPYIKELCEYPFFVDYTTLSEHKAAISSVIAESIMLINFYEHWNKNAEDRGEFLNDNAEPEMFEKLGEQLDRLYSIIDEDAGELFNSKNGVVFFKFFDEFCQMGLDDEVFGDFMTEFSSNLYGKVIGGDSFEELDKLRGTKDKGVLNRKLEVLRGLFAEFTGKNDEGISNQNFIVQNDENHTSETLENSVSEIEVFENLFSSDEKPETVRQFVNDVADETIDDEDMEVLEEDFEMITLDVDNSNPILDPENIKSIMAVMAYSYKEELDFESWFKDYAQRNTTYLFNQRENYRNMVTDLIAYNAA